jgi:hypothetical protein
VDTVAAKMVSKGINDRRDRNITREEINNKEIKKMGKEEKMEKTEELNRRNERKEVDKIMTEKTEGKKNE